MSNDTRYETKVVTPKKRRAEAERETSVTYETKVLTPKKKKKPREAK